MSSQHRYPNIFIIFCASLIPVLRLEIGKEYWGKGIATKALAEFLGYVKTRPLYAHVAKHNIGSQRVLQKCGFTVSDEGKFPDEKGQEIEKFISTLE